MVSTAIVIVGEKVFFFWKRLGWGKVQETKERMKERK